MTRQNIHKIKKYTCKEERWQAVVANDAGADNCFVYAVTTTGVFCRPSCRSKTPKPENVQFFDSPEQAVESGFRECKRCTPLAAEVRDENRKKIVKACRIIESCEQEIKLDDLAEKVSFSPYYFHRLFKKMIGVTPKQYFKMKQLKKLQKDIITEGSVTEAIYSSGFNSSSGFYKKVQNEFGMTPSRYKKGGAGVDIFYGFTQSFLGLVLIAATEKGVCVIEIGDDKQLLLSHLHDRFPKATLRKGDSVFVELLQEVVSAINSPEKAHSIPLDIQGTAFQKRVWQALLEIKPGTTMTYSELATKIGLPKGARAVASACAANQIALLVPCHRVIGKNGKLSGYKWGVERKKQILEQEKSNTDNENSMK